MIPSSAHIEPCNQVITAESQSLSIQHQLVLMKQKQQTKRIKEAEA
jgi:hypothetical protein